MKKNITYFGLFLFIVGLFLLNACSSDGIDDPGIDDPGNDNPNGDTGNDVITVAMVSVPAGTYDMGWDFSGASYSEPVHSVTLSAFSIGKYEITNAEIAEVFNWAKENDKFETVNADTVTNKGDSQELLDLNAVSHHITYNETDGEFSVTAGLGDDGSGGSVDLSDYPIFLISWYGAAAFCNYLSEWAGLTPCYDLSDWSCNFTADGYRLSTEAEWEYAARYEDGSNFEDGDWFSSGSAGYLADILSWNSTNADTTPHCNINTGVRGTHKVGTKSPNYLGIYDMTGNVSEWCNDFDDYYGSDPETDPTGPSGGSWRIYRGGSIGCNPGLIDSGLENSTRRSWYPDEPDISIGFRIVKRS